jgi:hypothetical protein
MRLRVGLVALVLAGLVHAGRAQAGSADAKDPPLKQSQSLGRKAVAGKEFVYRLRVEGRPGAKFYKEGGPPGMTISEDGTLRWTPPAEYAGRSLPALVTVRAGGRDQSINFEIPVVRGPAAKAPPRPAAGAEPAAGKKDPPIVLDRPLQTLPRKGVVGKEFVYQLWIKGVPNAKFLKYGGPRDATVTEKGLLRWVPSPEYVRAGINMTVRADKDYPVTVFIEVTRAPAAVATEKSRPGTKEPAITKAPAAGGKTTAAGQAPGPSHPVLTVPQPGGWVMTPDGVTLILSAPEQGELLYIDTVKPRLLRRVEVDFKPGALALQGHDLYAAAQGSSLVYVLDARTGKQKKEIDVGGDAVAHLACHPSRGLLYASTASFKVYAIDPRAGKAHPTRARGYFLAVDPRGGKYVYTGLQPPQRTEVVTVTGPDGKVRFVYDDWGPRAVLVKYVVAGTDLRSVAVQTNAAVNGWWMHLTPDGKRITIVVGGGWRPPAGSGTGGGYVAALFSTDNLKSMVGQVPVGLNLAVHPVLNILVVNHHGLDLTLHNARSLVVRRGGKVVLSRKECRTPSVLTFGGRGRYIIVWNGNDRAGNQGLHFVPLELTAAERAALRKAYPEGPRGEGP